MLGDAYAFIDPVFSTGVLSGDEKRVPRRRCGDRLPAPATRRGRPRAAPLRDGSERRARQVLLVHLSHQHARHARPVHGAAQLFRMQEAVLSLLSGDVFDHSPIHSRLLLFKGVFYIKTSSLRQARRFGARGRPLAPAKHEFRRFGQPHATVLLTDRTRLHGGSIATTRHAVLIPSYNTGARLFDTVAIIRRIGLAGLGCHRWQHRRHRRRLAPHRRQRSRICASACCRETAARAPPSCMGLRLAAHAGSPMR